MHGPMVYLVHQFFRQQVEVVYVAVASCLLIQLKKGAAKVCYLRQMPDQVALC
jgi:hypothetical protein